jgi:predicted membrane protein
VLVAIVFGVAGLVIDRATGVAVTQCPLSLASDSAMRSSAMGWGFTICFIVGVGLAALAVRRRGIFTAMVQAPILLALFVLVTFRLVHGCGTFSSAAQVVQHFPGMAVATGVGILLGLIRIIAQPATAPRNDGHRSDVDDDSDQQTGAWL